MRGGVKQGEPAGFAARAAAMGGSGRRLLACIRFDEVWVLQGAPLLGALFAMRGFAPADLLTVAVLVAGNICLVAHVFVFNDWAGIAGDLKDPHRAGRTFMRHGVDRGAVGRLALALLALALLLFSHLGGAAVLLALTIAGLSALYSAPVIHGKGRPVVSSVLHVLGGALHFMLGAAAFPPASWHAAAIGLYFGLVFAAGHLTHEARDHEGDSLAGIRTSAVAFGRRGAALASLGLFTLAYAYLAALALCGVLPTVLALLGLLWPLHLLATLQALRPAPTHAGLRRLQDRYRLIHAVIGLAMVTAALAPGNP